jgi:hypothetical protein
VIELSCLSIQKKKPFTRRRDLRGLKEPTLSEQILQQTATVKYLGLTLDKGLTWKAQMTNVMNKATGLFGLVRAHLVNLGSETHRVVYLICTVVVGPMLPYGSTVSRQKVRPKVSKTELSKLQILACLAITDAMKMTTTAAMEVLLGLLPRHVMIEAEAQGEIYRLMCYQQ